MSRKGNCWDNVLRTFLESYKLHSKHTQDRLYAGPYKACQDIFCYIEVFLQQKQA